ncbi:MAG: LPXTG cell wall anchor domain-containing protein [Corynebacterium sp.]|uniref:LPXTG cell wall anchor domain-containing protein n=1 Tax=unclassified Corynebacterium TaxID=2624378 RepID=UPI002648BB1E|nr:LPXTG cell wall anchor domain-containing protein [Corynebacterium sp.]MDN5581131.1 LPXTG cell wall anchor domain-containing protein [Corynebacterium sp.]MDN5720053.1 LPXTG cell wall anchor domain-containing protein [Corynebacterium sp.]MDN6324480.1 LPXTG cell wall anchor domain-containing protein [Corynebacterium sp.]MDN6510202.1 LPXTG cell wall anchor domain-containing protein [Corynebacterium sp.]
MSANTTDTAGATPMTDPAAPATHRAGAFDIRTVTAALLGIYGVVLLLVAAFMDPGVNPDTGEAKSMTDNVWAGIALIVVAGALVLWARLNPVVVDESLIDEDKLPGADD